MAEKGVFEISFNSDQQILPPKFSGELKNLLCPKCGKGMYVRTTKKHPEPFYICVSFPACKYIHKAYPDGTPHPGLDTEKQRIVHLYKECTRLKQKTNNAPRNSAHNQPFPLQKLEVLRGEALTSLTVLMGGIKLPDGSTKALPKSDLPEWSTRHVGFTMYSISCVQRLKPHKCQTLIQQVEHQKNAWITRWLFEKFYAYYPDGTPKGGEELSRHRLKALQYIHNQTGIPVHVYGDVGSVTSKEDANKIMTLLHELISGEKTIDHVMS